MFLSIVLLSKTWGCIIQLWHDTLVLVTRVLHDCDQSYDETNCTKRLQIKVAKVIKISSVSFLVGAGVMWTLSLLVGGTIIRCKAELQWGFFEDFEGELCRESFAIQYHGNWDVAYPESS